LTAAAPGPCVGHVAAEAMDGEPIALVQDGDRVMLDASKGVIDIEVDDASAYFEGELGVAGPLL
jgi:dihydroxyacid dehydratase/phosphogluconate dehydratase